MVAKQLVNREEINPKVARIDGREEATISGRRFILPFFATIPGRQKATVPVAPQQVGKPLRLVYGGEPRQFLISDIRIGRNSQFSSLGQIPAESFPPHPEPGEAINNIAGIDTFQVGMNVSIEIENIGQTQANFGGFILCEATA